MKTSVVIPAYKVKKHLKEVITTIPDFVTHIIVVDDKCPQHSGEYALSLNIERVTVIFHEVNQGVGGSVFSGYQKALELASDVVVKVDGDGQMDPNFMKSLIQPIIDGHADYTKGNRFKDFKALKSMPKIRLFGNSVLSFLVKMASGYWNVMDPTNGYTAIHKRALEGLNFDHISKRYFFESDMLIHLNIENMVVQDISIPTRYGDEESSLNIKKVLYQFPVKILQGLLKRIFYKYYIYDFNMASIYLFLGIPMVLFGGSFGIIKWVQAIDKGIETSTGTVMLSVLPIILGVQFLLQAISIDIDNIPKK
ncbi:glycosyltransferase family 2 protein [Sulfuricurvum sp.]|uniref:glycosyltransferase family 2 protein n=1 Tax=Sulfuricurvum sp. TaxID=2025608 RepID=UPI00263873B2|nr:glycosyltransferase family 2 protein [Sulfuricurvum sp.]MDD3595849.1 glycosyltransferase family 2 protein [Sulfuricurvum sp.]MDD4882947.1 glycosyltransferase family 2 protein [Sulfuricurvum sp.]